MPPPRRSASCCEWRTRSSRLPIERRLCGSAGVTELCELHDVKVNHDLSENAGGLAVLALGRSNGDVKTGCASINAPDRTRRPWRAKGLLAPLLGAHLHLDR